MDPKIYVIYVAFIGVFIRSRVCPKSRQIIKIVQHIIQNCVWSDVVYVIILIVQIMSIQENILELHRTQDALMSIFVLKRQNQYILHTQIALGLSLNMTSLHLVIPDQVKDRQVVVRPVTCSTVHVCIVSKNGTYSACMLRFGPQLEIDRSNELVSGHLEHYRRLQGHTTLENMKQSDYCHSNKRMCKDLQLRKRAFPRR